MRVEPGGSASTGAQSQALPGCTLTTTVHGKETVPSFFEPTSTWCWSARINSPHSTVVFVRTTTDWAPESCVVNHATTSAPTTNDQQREGGYEQPRGECASRFRQVDEVVAALQQHEHREQGWQARETGAPPLRLLA
ncbi:hypothetical protein [Streptomyces sp. NPDC056670]|uniref:hypothetical protein n=1 Tax=Streptomyces sp. NPDC056670 TaxID=3345904 RepID=UPI0036A6E797